MFDNKERKLARLENIVPDTLSTKTYNSVIGGVTLYGLIINALIVSQCGDYFAHMNPWVLIIGYFISALLGIFISAKSSNPYVSFIGYNLVVLPVGALLSVALQGFEKIDIASAMLLTGITVFVMIFAAILYPNFFSGLGKTLFFSLLIGLIVEIIGLFIGVSSFNTLLFDVFFVIIFSLYIGYDWYKSQEYSKTLDNAIDSALDIYLDIINLFLRILRILARNRD